MEFYNNRIIVNRIIVDLERVDADGILDSLLSEKDKEDRSINHAGRKAWEFMTALEAAMRQARSRPEMTFKWGSRFWSNKPILGPIKLNFEAGRLDIRYGPDGSDRICCGVNGLTFYVDDYGVIGGWPRPDASAANVKSVSEAFSIVMGYLIRAGNRVPKK